MFTNQFQQSPKTLQQLIILTIGICLTFFTFAAVSHGQIEGFTEPYRSIDLSSDEAGAIAELKVEEGFDVEKGDVIARLDDRVQQVQLEIATEMANATSQLDAARKTLEKRRTISDRLRSMQANGHASDSELIRSEMELSIAEAKYNAAREESAIRAMEKQRAEIQFSRRSITAPMGGIVSTVHRREGEYLSPLRPEVITIIQVDRLLSTFNIPVSQANEFRVGKEFELKFESGKSVVATVHSVSVSTDAQSQTVEVKLVFENRGRIFRAGEICTLNI
ncbi:efflux RND transporter periplasmic adaptor subunit [Mariniblastus fucicola]|uniref:Multidrug resistance protein MdtN n=1 Tax=Mariniblastus fucicola TaxID=980251 RepID=A0A5B9PCT5_9BACT|nr:efflux RND transporter periplasmic adaptor subunit [Mariniblastus fucicola]QEG20901.1 multidrug resistance protein MdtN [Mariniblastus fucicola]